METKLPIDLLHWILAFLILLVLLILLVGLRWKAHEAGTVGIFIAWLFTRMKGIASTWTLVLIIFLIHSGGQSWCRLTRLFLLSLLQRLL
ncbi:MAG: hypothetical protein PHU23_07070 [Dehalococcoidales bacterium]|nr:hypothetical protein [Dehalococcoidales bacterium]